MDRHRYAEGISPTVSSPERRRPSTRATRLRAAPFALIVFVLLAALSSLVLPSRAAAQDAPPESWAIGTGDLPDPHIVRGAERWWVFGTNSGGQLVPTRSSNDLLNWRAESDALAHRPAWGIGEIWAPAVARIGDKWVMYFTDKNNNPSSPDRCIGVAVSSSSGGPYQPHDFPLACDTTRGGHVDASPFVDAQGNPWLLYKNDDPTRDGIPVIRSRPLSSDGLAFAGAEVALVEASAPWEAGVNENPSMITGPDGTLHLFWSGNDWRTSSYSMGHATCATPAGPCTEDSQPWLTGLPGGSGGGSLTPILAGTPGEDALLTVHQWQRAEGYERGGFRAAALFTVAFNKQRPRIVPATIERLGPFAETCAGRLATIVGTDADDQIQGTDFDDVIVARSGADRVLGGAGEDIICGGDGDDVLRGGQQRDIIRGNDGNDTLRGDTGRDALAGGPGEDQLVGGKHNDRLVGGGGDDRLNGGKGDDQCTTDANDRQKNC